MFECLSVCACLMYSPMYYFHNLTNARKKHFHFQANNNNNVKAAQKRYANGPMCNMKRSSVMIKPQQFSSALSNILVSFSSLFRFYSPQLYCFGSLSLLPSILFPTAAKRLWFCSASVSYSC